MRARVRASAALLLVLGAPAGGFTLASGVLVDPERGTVYLMKPGGGVEAVGLEGGRLLWTTAQAAKPLALHNHRLLALAEPPANGALRLVVLDANSGKRLLQKDAPLPPGVRASIDDGPGTAFDTTARPDRGSVVVAWRFVQRPVSGLAPPPELTPPTRAEEGALRIDLRTGRAEPLGREEGFAPGVPATPKTARVNRDGKECVVLQPGEPRSEVVLACGKPVATLASADRRHLVVSLRAEDERTEQAGYVWSVHALPTGARVARFPSTSSALPFFVWDSRLVHEALPSGRRVDGAWVEEPRTLRGLDLGSGAPVWSRPLRDPVYRGPYPAAG
jgi:hypothetical protein